MRHIETGTLATQDISATLVAHAYTADRARLIFMRLFIDGVAGGGEYTAYLTIQRGGAGAEFYIVPLTVTPVDSGYGSILLTTIAIPINEDDIVKAYLKGRGADLAVDITAEVWEDDSNFYTAAPGNYPSGSLGEALGRIGSEPTIRIQVPLMDTSRLEIVRGDDYNDDHSTGIVLSSDDWPDLTEATVAFITTEVTVAATVQAARQVLVELTGDETLLLTGGYFSLVATFSDGDEVSLVPKAKLHIKDRVG